MVMWVVYATFINFTYTLYVNVEFFYKRTLLISTGTIIAAIVNVVLNGMFLKQYGYQFGTISTLISYVALLIFHMIIVNCVMKKNVTDNIFVVAIVILIFVITCILHLFLDVFIYRILIGVIGELVIGGITYGLYRKYGIPNFNIE